MADVLLPLRPDEEKMFFGQPKGFPLADFEINDVMLPDDDDLGIESEDDEIAEDEIETETGFGSVIGEDRCPVVQIPLPCSADVFQGGLWAPCQSMAPMNRTQGSTCNYQQDS